MGRSTDSSNVFLNAVQPGTCRAGDASDCNNVQGKTAFRISGDSYNISISGANSFFAISISDASRQYATMQIIPGSPSAVSSVWYESGHGTGVGAINLTDLNVLQTLAVHQNLYQQAHSVIAGSTPTLTGTGCAANLVHDTAGIFTTAALLLR